MTGLGGYHGKAREVLEAQGLQLWSEVVLETTRGRFRGIVLPRPESKEHRYIVLKLDNGYNVSVDAATVTGAVEEGRREPYYHLPARELAHDPTKPRVKLFGTGGTIASRLDYRTGAAVPAFSPGELWSSVPELTDICNLETEELYNVLSENMGPEHWIGIARAVAREIEAGVDGVVIGHGTDTMHHTASALSFMVQDPPVPIVMVGAQRSSDRPSSDAALNLMHAAKVAAESDIAEVSIVMFGPTSDEYGIIHRGTRARKMHSSSRSAFRTIGDVPLGIVSREKIEPLRTDYRRRRADRNVKLQASFEERVALLHYYPNMQPEVIDMFVDRGYRGLVLAGTGLGHVSRALFPSLRRAHERGVALYMTVQTLWGYAQMHVYDTGRQITELGVVPAENMLPEIAYVKLGWALSLTEDPAKVRELMLTPISGEITEREPHDGYLIFQAGLPWLAEYYRRYLR